MDNKKEAVEIDDYCDQPGSLTPSPPSPKKKINNQVLRTQDGNKPAASSILSQKFHSSKSLKEFYKKRKERLQRVCSSSSKPVQVKQQTSINNNQENAKENNLDIQVQATSTSTPTPTITQSNSMEEAPIQNNARDDVPSMSTLEISHIAPIDTSSLVQARAPALEEGEEEEKKAITYILPIEDSADAEREMPPPNATTVKSKMLKKRMGKVAIQVTSQQRSPMITQPTKVSTERSYGDWEPVLPSLRDYGFDHEDSFITDDGTDFTECTDEASHGFDFDTGTFLCGFCTAAPEAPSSKRVTQAYQNMMESSTFSTDNAIRGVKYLRQQSTTLHEKITKSLTNETLDSYLDLVEQSFQMKPKKAYRKPQVTRPRRKEPSADFLTNASSYDDFDTSIDTYLEEDTYESLETEDTVPVNNTSTHHGKSFELPKDELIELMRGTVSELATQPQGNNDEIDPNNVDCENE